MTRLHAPLLATLGFLTVLVVGLLVGGIVLRGVVANAFADADAVRAARMLVADLLQDQLDEETGIRGYAAARRRILLEPYQQARAGMGPSFDRIPAVLAQAKMRAAINLIADARHTNRRWLDEVARPIMAGGNTTEIELHGKRLIDHFRSDLEQLQQRLALRQTAADERAQHAILGISIFAMMAIVAIVIAASVFTIQQFRLASRLEEERRGTEEERRRTVALRAAYEVEKRIADTLQEAFAQSVLPRLAGLYLSAAFIPATEETLVGGDWYDALELADQRVMFTIGDVTGHGLEAAVTMNRTRQLFLSCALLDPEPGSLLACVNRELVRLRSPLLTAVTGVVDATRQIFSYAVAGHPPPVLAEPGRKPRLLQTGSLPLGVSDDAVFQARTIQSVPGAMLVLYTDGAIEHSRNVLEGEALLLDGVEQAALHTTEDAASIICDRIMPDRHVVDDVAILTIRFGEGSKSSLSRRAL